MQRTKTVKTYIHSQAFKNWFQLIFTPYPPISILTYILFNIKYYISLCGYISLMLTLLIFVKQLTRNSSTILWKNMHMELIKILTRKQKTSNFIQTRKLPPFENNFLKQEAPFYSQRVILHFLGKRVYLRIICFSFWTISLWKKSKYFGFHWHIQMRKLGPG